MQIANKFFKLILIAIYVGISILLFNRVYATSKEVIDELFHLGQGMEYCRGNYSAVSFCLLPVVVGLMGKISRFSGILR
jgi:hypothetical protein